MTDNEIKKALVCCINNKCSKCPLKAMNCSKNIAMAFANEFINRLQAENERLNNLCQEQNTEIKRQIEIKNRLLYNLKSVCKERNEENAKSEAIKEFIEKLICEIVNRPSEKAPDGVFYMNGRVDRQNEIIDIIKELAGAYSGIQKETETSE